MKKSQVFLFCSMLLGFLASCSTDVDLYADYKDVAIIYAMIDPRDDTTYVKIVRAFCGSNDDSLDANAIAMIADSSNYPGKLEARIIELKSTFGGPYELTGREFLLDTMTIHNKEEGMFYFPDQLFYYTTERFKSGTDRNRYKYRLLVVKPDGDTVSAQTNMVGNEEFSILTSEVGFQIAPTDAMKQIAFSADEEASLYEIIMQFNYREQLSGHEMESKYISKSLGTKSITEYYQGTGGAYIQSYSMNWLFNDLALAIGGDTVWDVNHPNVVRYIDDFVITICAGGDELTLYYLQNQAQMSSPTSLVAPYTNIENGFGLFSSRATISKVVRMSAKTKREFFTVPSWGFKEQ